MLGRSLVIGHQLIATPCHREELDRIHAGFDEIVRGQDRTERATVPIGTEAGTGPAPRNERAGVRLGGRADERPDPGTRIWSHPELTGLPNPTGEVPVESEVNTTIRDNA